MPTELKGASDLRKALKKFAPDLDKETRDEMVGFLKPLVKKARGFLPSNSDAPSGFVKHEVKTAKFPMYDASEARRGIGYKLTPTKPNRNGWVQTVSIHNLKPLDVSQASLATSRLDSQDNSQAEARCQAVPCLRLTSKMRARQRLA